MADKAKAEEQKEGLKLLKKANDERSANTRQSDELTRKTPHKRVIRDEDDKPSKFAKQAEEAVKPSVCECGKADCKECEGRIHLVAAPVPATPGAKHVRVKDDDTEKPEGK